MLPFLTVDVYFSFFRLLFFIPSHQNSLLFSFSPPFSSIPLFFLSPLPFSSFLSPSSFFPVPLPFLS